MKLLSVAISISCLLGTLCAGKPILERSNTVTTTLFPRSNLQNGHLPERIALPDTSTTPTDGYVFFKARMLLRDPEGQPFSNWVLLGAKYSAIGRAVHDSPAYVIQANLRNGKWSAENQKVDTGVLLQAVLGLVDKYKPVAWVPEAGIEGVLGALVAVSVGGLSNDVGEGKIEWNARVIDFLHDGQQHSYD
ncbi:MAG: hypothetical protein M1829_002889 [Trizodia sp. TS-e1964]|nr:MAG: hypothetical protein M1829_002889 [Trizodia sp. TS-e1964]